MPVIPEADPGEGRGGYPGPPSTCRTPDNPTFAVPLVKSRLLKALAIDSAERSQLLGNVPALARDVPWVRFDQLVRGSCPAEDTAPDCGEAVSRRGLQGTARDGEAAKPQGHAGPEFTVEPAAFFRAESERWRKFIVAAGIKAG